MSDALVLSLPSFHGRVFYPELGSEAMLPNPPVVPVAEEAVIGLFIESSFIATFTQGYLESHAHLNKMVPLMTSHVVS